MFIDYTSIALEFWTIWWISERRTTFTVHYTREINRNVSIKAMSDGAIFQFSFWKRNSTVKRCNLGKYASSLHFVDVFSKKSCQEKRVFSTRLIVRSFSFQVKVIRASLFYVLLTWRRPKQARLWPKTSRLGSCFYFCCWKTLIVYIIADCGVRMSNKQGMRV